jgi:ABC-type bacteriocin/lantibiotic exporter with double-glycine peptidase domain
MEFIFIYVYFFKINIYVGLITIVICLIVFLILVKYGNKLEKLTKGRKDTMDKKTGILQEIFLGIKEIKGLNLISSINKRVHTSTEEYLTANAKYTINYNKNKSTSLFFIEFFRLILFFYGIHLISTGQMQVGVLLIIYNYYSKLIDNLNEVGTINMEYRNLNTSWLRFNKLIEYSRSTDKTVKELNDDLAGRIIFDKVLYGNKSRPYLKNVSFTIDPREITVITGKVGSDKNGIFDLLLRLNRQHNGLIAIDDIDIDEYDDNAYYNLVSSAREQPIFFSLSIKENLEIIEPDFVKVVEVCKKLNIHDYIMNLKDGYDTILTTSADNINATIKQLLSIARVLLKDPRVMLFYDTMATFDQETLDNVLKILKEKKQDHTIVVISRSKEILKVAD